jgi:hypothetical protein
MNMKPSMGEVTEAEHRELQNINFDKAQEEVDYLAERMRRNHEMILGLIEAAIQKPRREK